MPELLVGSLGIPLMVLAAVLCLKGRPNLREAVTMVGSVSLFAWNVNLCAQWWQTAPHHGQIFWEFIPLWSGLGIRFTAEPLGLLFALLASSLWIVNSIYSIVYMRRNKEQRQTRFFACFALALFCVMGIALAADLLTLFIFYEALTLCTWPLVTHKGDAKAMAGGRVYLGYLLGTSICLLLPAILIVFSILGRLDFQPGGMFNGAIDPVWAMPLALLFALGVGKAALFPVHRWLPAAMVAPTPVSALLHAVAVVKAGVFIIIKLGLQVFGVELLQAALNPNILLWLAAFTILYASLCALMADNLKRRLAWSTISQLSYVTLAVAILAPLSIIGAILHLVAHAFGKITLFFVAGSIYTMTKRTEVSQLDGIGRSMPWTMTAFAVGSLSMIGLPPTAGFFSKWYILQGAWQMQAWLAIAVIVLSTLLNAAYFLPIVYRAFFRPPASAAESSCEAPAWMLVAIWSAAFMTLALFFFPDFLIATATEAL
ncbi:MAG: proton-conducting transporter transmembrane domain-containing protein [Candidatus Eutrophobiaceae bacterium]